MAIEAIRLENFMAFKDTGWLDLHPITLLFGHNSSGKTAIIRALRLLKQSLISSEDVGPLVLSARNGLDIGSYKSLIYNGNVKEIVRFRFSCIDSSLQDLLNQYGLLDSVNNKVIPTKIEYSVGFGARRQMYEELDLGVIELMEVEISITEDDQKLSRIFYGIRLDPEDLTGDSDEWYIGGKLILQNAEDSWKGFGFRHGKGFLPDLIEPIEKSQIQKQYEILKGLLHQLNDEVQQFLSSIIYLGPIRPEPRRQYSFDHDSSLHWLEQGWSAFLDFIVGRASPIGEEVNGWIDKLSLGKKADSSSSIDSTEVFKEFEVGIGETNNGKLHALSAVGYGTSQVLPVIIQSLLAPAGALVIIEQPELHLHPRAQASLANMFIAALRRVVRMKRAERRGIKDKNNDRLPPDALIDCPRFLLETHSEHLLLRFRRVIAETFLAKLQNQPEANFDDKKVPDNLLLLPRDISIYYINRFREEPTSAPYSQAFRAQIDDYGDIPDPPPGFSLFFADDAADVLRITKAALTAEAIAEESEK